MNERKGKSMTSTFVIVPLMWILFICFSPQSACAESSSSLLVSVSDDYFKNTKNGAMWTKARSKRFEQASEAQAYLDMQNSGEFDDWRIPTKQELFDMLSVFDLKNNGEVKVRIEGRYWLADSKGQMSVGTWEIGDGCGPERRFFSGGKGYVRAIRP